MNQVVLRGGGIQIHNNAGIIIRRFAAEVESKSKSYLRVSLLFFNLLNDHSR